MSFKSLLLSSVLIASSILGIANKAAAENFATVNGADGTVYQIDLDSREESVSSTGWRHVKFYLSTESDDNKHKAIASCEPYQLKSEYYNLDWLENRADGSAEDAAEDTVAGAIARVACGSDESVIVN
jgi:hypothetical protein